MWYLLRVSIVMGQCASLDGFVCYLESLSARPDLDELQERMEGLELTRADLDVYARFDEKNYARNLIFETETVQLLCLCWRSGQRSPIHDHAQSICGVRVMEGVATETRFERVPSGYIKAVSSQDCCEGAVVVSQDAETHQISNLEGEGQDLITLHLYSPPLNSMKTYSIESKRSSEYRPQNYEVMVDGSGI
jgi:cysteine dioxygenase